MRTSLWQGYSPLLVQYARQGCAAGLRGRVWLAALRLGTVSERDYNYFGSLQREIGRVALATDEMVRKDAAAPSREVGGATTEPHTRDALARASVRAESPAMLTLLAQEVSRRWRAAAPSHAPARPMKADGLTTPDWAGCAQIALWAQEDYFVFAELVEEILLAFCRDPVAARRATHPKPQPLIARNKAGQRAAFPPNEMPPGKGLADYVCPLCFVFQQPPELYFCFRELWARYWCKLQCLSSTAGTLLPLLRLFEDLLQVMADWRLRMAFSAPTRTSAPAPCQLRGPCLTAISPATPSSTRLRSVLPPCACTCCGSS